MVTDGPPAQNIAEENLSEPDQTKIRLRYFATPADLQQARSLGKKHSTLARRIVSNLVLFVVGVWSAISRDGISFPPPRGRFDVVGGSAQNLWITLVPSLFIVSRLIMSYAVVLPVRAKILDAARARQITNFALNVPYLWSVPLLVPRLAIYWSPTESQVVFAALAPWMLYKVIAVSVHAYRVKHWAASQRETTCEISAVGMVTDDGISRHEFRWAYFNRYSENKTQLLFVTEHGNTMYLPKRAIPSLEQLHAIKAMISNNIPAGSFNIEARGFEVTLPAFQTYE